MNCMEHFKRDLPGLPADHEYAQIHGVESVATLTKRNLDDASTGNYHLPYLAEEFGREC